MSEARAWWWTAGGALAGIAAGSALGDGAGALAGAYGAASAAATALVTRRHLRRAAGLEAAAVLRRGLRCELERLALAAVLLTAGFALLPLEPLSLLAGFALGVAGTTGGAYVQMTAAAGRH